MDPYRSPPEDASLVEPELDRVPVSLRVLPVRTAWLVVTPTALRLEPRVGRARTVAIERGPAALRLGRETRAAATVASWQRIVASAPYGRALRAAPYPGILARVHGHSFAGGVAEGRAFVAIIEGEQLIVIEAAPAFDVCFARGAGSPWPDASGRLLGRALSWVARDELARALVRIRAGVPAGACRMFTRDEVRARPSYALDRRLFQLLGNDARDAIALEPSLAELVTLERWIATGDVG